MEVAIPLDVTEEVAALARQLLAAVRTNLPAEASAAARISLALQAVVFAGTETGAEGADAVMALAGATAVLMDDQQVAAPEIVLGLFAGAAQAALLRIRSTRAHSSTEVGHA